MVSRRHSLSWVLHGYYDRTLGSGFCMVIEVVLIYGVMMSCTHQFAKLNFAHYCFAGAPNLELVFSVNRQRSAHSWWWATNEYCMILLYPVTVYRLTCMYVLFVDCDCLHLFTISYTALKNQKFVVWGEQWTKVFRYSFIFVFVQIFVSGIKLSIDSFWMFTFLNAYFRELHLWVKIASSIVIIRS